MLSKVKNWSTSRCRSTPKFYHFHSVIPRPRLPCLVDSHKCSQTNDRTNVRQTNSEDYITPPRWSY